MMDGWTDRQTFNRHTDGQTNKHTDTHVMTIPLGQGVMMNMKILYEFPSKRVVALLWVPENEQRQIPDQGESDSNICYMQTLQKKSMHAKVRTHVNNITALCHLNAYNTFMNHCK